MPSKRSWKDQLGHSRGGLPRVEQIRGKLVKRWGSDTVVIPAPHEVDGFMRLVPRGKVTTINEIRTALARGHGASIGSPITTGIFAWVAAHAAEEDRAASVREVTPCWRIPKAEGC